MKKNIKYSLILLFLLVISLSAVSASDNVTNDNEIMQTSDISIYSNNSYSEVNDYSDSNDINSIANEYSISSSNYNSYFDSNGNILSSSGINDGDTIKLTGTFNDVNFVISKQLNVIGDNVIINNGTITISSSGSGSFLSNLKIINNKDGVIGIFVDGASNCNIANNNINTKGISSFAIAVNPGSTYNNITNNFLKSGGLQYEGSTKSTSPFVMGGANYNYIANNYVECDDANGIYFSTYGSGAFIGGECNYNIVYNNTVKCAIALPTSWCYGIQLMGSNNKADSNTVIGTYRGISVGSSSNVTNNKIINLTGKDFGTGAVIGGEYAIVGGTNTIVANNNISNSLISNAGIYVSSGSSVSNNNVNISGKGYGIQANGDNIQILDNNISTDSGGGVYQAGKYSNLTVKNNNISAVTGVGILLVKSTSSKYPSNITITDNIISTSNEYAINAADADKSTYTIANNKVGSSKILTPNGEVTPDPTFEFNGNTYIVTPDNYHSFFDENGNLINEDVVDGDILSFVGTFENIQPIISNSIKIIGQNPIFKNSKIIVTSDSVWIENLTINNTASTFANPWGIYAENIKNIMIRNNTIFVYDDSAAYAVYLCNVNTAFIEDNKLSSSGDYLTYTVLGYGLENAEISNNIITTNGTGQIHGWEATKCLDGIHSVAEIYRTYGILLISASNNNITNNKVTVTSKLETENAQINGTTATNSLVGIDAYFDCNNNNFINNNVSVYGKDNYIYGMGVIGAQTGTGSDEYSQYNKFEGNNINITGYNMGTGLITGYHSLNNNLTNNNITVNANKVAYGITLELASNSVVDSNNINLSSEVNYGIEIFDGDLNTLSNNNITAKGIYAYGIGAYGSNNNTIIKNNISVEGSASKPVEETSHWDSLGVGNDGIILKASSSNNLIDDNYIVSTKGYAVNLTDTTSNTVTNNYLKGEDTAANDSVVASEGNTVKNNYGKEFSNPTVEDKSVEYLGTLTLIANSGISGDNQTTVYFYLNGKLVGFSQTSNGIASLTLKLNSSYIVGQYTIGAVFERESYKTTEVNGILTVIKSDIVITLNDCEGKKGTAVALEATVKDKNGNVLNGTTVEFYRGSIYMGKAITDENGVAKLIYTIPATISGSSMDYTVKIDSSTNYNNASSSSKITFTDKVQTQIIVNDIQLYYKNGTQFEATLTDLKGNPIANQKVGIKIIGKTYEFTTDSKGKFSLPINLIQGTYDCTAIFNGTSIYYGSSSSATVTVLNTVTGKNIVKYYKNGTQFEACIVDGNGNPLKNTEVTFNIIGKIYTVKSNEKGIATLPINLNPGVYIITSTNSLNGEMFSNNITVLSSIAGKDIVKYYRNGTQYSATFLDAQGNPLANKNVTFNIIGKLYSIETDDEGVATLPINLNPGKYIITAINPVDGLMYSNSIKVLPTLICNDLTKKYGSSETYDVKVVDAQGKPCVGVDVEFNIIGKLYTLPTGDDGVAKLPINLIAGKYIVTAKDPNNGLYVSKTITVTA